ncbi:hypothetical protein BpHYR1_025033 [Brachionus plicatilis]|uniref:Uncharacterized protein n=1 Tax=Brachionus plicatilis TaxID=10195 RepID=A0A3M7RPR6_BRAPC|nr:hypothetical protein BpHYR1_025033 [Brachionus plicatilis]
MLKLQQNSDIWQIYSIRQPKTNEAKITDKKSESTSNVICAGPVIVAAGVDETSTTNTDVSDPHWDGYTSSPFYSNSVTVEDFCFSDKNQPVLPWDELFFELDPNEDIPHKQNR